MADLQNSPERGLVCTVDRFERTEEGTTLAVLVFDDGQQLVTEAGSLPGGTVKGTVLRVSFTIDEAETDARNESIKSLQDELFRD